MMGEAEGVMVGGLTRFSATDYPGLLSAVVFVQGCPWRCGYCHNPHLQVRDKAQLDRWPGVVEFLQKRRGLIDAVVFSGGEPCTDGGLISSARQVVDMGFKVGLHTAGIYPRRLAEVLPHLDWVGLDIKGTPKLYDAITGTACSAEPAWASLNLLLNSGVNCEVRTTLQPGLHSEVDIRALGLQLSGMGVKHYALQEFRATGCSSASLHGGHSLVASTVLRHDLATMFSTFTYRPAAI